MRLSLESSTQLPVNFEKQYPSAVLTSSRDCSTESPGGGGGGTQAFFDRDARPRTNFNYPKNRMNLNSTPPPSPNRMSQNSNPKDRMTQDAMFVKV